MEPNPKLSSLGRNLDQNEVNSNSNSSNLLTSTQIPFSRAKNLNDDEVKWRNLNIFNVIKTFLDTKFFLTTKEDIPEDLELSDSKEWNC